MFASIRQGDFHLRRPSCDMVVGEDMALGVDDHSRSQAFHFLFELLGHFGSAKETPKERVILKGQEGIGDFPAFGHFDVDDGREVLLCHLYNGSA
jgi:hypothetical protein